MAAHDGAEARPEGRLVRRNLYDTCERTRKSTAPPRQKLPTTAPREHCPQLLLAQNRPLFLLRNSAWNRIKIDFYASKICLLHFSLVGASSRSWFQSAERRGVEGSCRVKPRLCGRVIFVRSSVCIDRSSNWSKPNPLGWMWLGLAHWAQNVVLAHETWWRWCLFPSAIIFYIWMPEYISWQQISSSSV